MQTILILSWHHIFIMDILNMDRLHACIYMCMLSHFSHVWLFVTPWTIIHQAPLSMGILQARILEWVAMPSSRGSSRPRDEIRDSYILHWQADSLPLAPPGKPMAWFSSVQSSRSVVSDSMQSHGLQDARPPCLSPTPGVYSNPCPLIQWHHPTISSSIISFSSHPQSFPAAGSLPVSQFFTLGGQSIGVSASASVLPMNIQDGFPFGWTGWISLQSKGLSRVFNTTVQKHEFFSTQLSL